MRPFAPEDRIADAADTVRSTVDGVASRMPDMIETVRDGALEGARTIRSLPDPNQRLIAVFSLGLAVGMFVAGAPRILVAAAIAPAIVVAGSIVGSDDARPHPTSN